MIVLCVVFGVVTMRTVRQRARHRRLLDLVTHETPEYPGTEFLADRRAVAYCLPGLRPRIVLSEGTQDYPRTGNRDVGRDPPRTGPRARAPRPGDVPTAQLQERVRLDALREVRTGEHRPAARDGGGRTSRPDRRVGRYPLAASRPVEMSAAGWAPSCGLALTGSVSTPPSVPPAEHAARFDERLRWPRARPGARRCCAPRWSSERDVAASPGRADVQDSGHVLDREGAPWHRANRSLPGQNDPSLPLVRNANGWRRGSPFSPSVRNHPAPGYRPLRKRRRIMKTTRRERARRVPIAAVASAAAAVGALAGGAARAPAAGAASPPVQRFRPRRSATWGRCSSRGARPSTS